MNNISSQSAPSNTAKVLAWIISLPMAGFYILSSLGWFFATAIFLTGHIHNQQLEVVEFFESLSPIDHIFRTLQVLLVVIGSILLLFRRSIALPPFVLCLALSIISTFFVRKWAITFIGGAGINILALVCTYTYWLKRKRLLK